MDNLINYQQILRKYGFLAGIVVILLALCLFLVPGFQSYESCDGILVLDIDKIVNESDAGKDLNRTSQNSVDDSLDKLKDLRENIKDLDRKIEMGQASGKSKRVIKKLEEQRQFLAKKFQWALNMLNNKASQEMNEGRNEIREVVTEKADDVRHKKGSVMVIDSRSVAAMDKYIGIDITEQVMKMTNNSDLDVASGFKLDIDQILDEAEEKARDDN